MMISRDITQQNVPFSGKVFLMGEDFQQVLPAVRRKPRTVTVENYIKSSSLRPLFSVVKLKICVLLKKRLILRHGNSSYEMDLSADTAICDDQTEAKNYSVEFRNSITHSGIPPHRLNVVEGAIVILQRNLCINKGLCN